ncbi:hypothetical protein [Paludisphaera mucosa]|uniref:Uncharacterized protein n=1 Tax=Paludisphaera mucosa TaxID=3030827 RepID=A0ABT6FCL7_9BACT|nr:hypothetical protein [Paludisphaera mucosa]MDG3005307.1 hypothetical protein [Paludisphaera mucosa]
MNATRPRLGTAFGLIVGLILGVLIAGGRPQPMLAGGSDRSGESIVVTGPIAVRFDEGHKVQIPEDALYYLDYKAGKLKATLPTYRQTATGTRHLDVFAERDLVADFALDVDNGPKPHFLMTTGQLGTLGEGWAPLFVIETTTGKAGVYRVRQAFGVRNKLSIELIEVRSTNPVEEAAAVVAPPAAR